MKNLKFKLVALAAFFICSASLSESQKYINGEIVDSVVLIDSTTGLPYTAGSGAGGATSANQTNGTQQTRITNGTQTADTIAGGSGQNNNALLTAGGSYVVQYTITGAGTTTPFNTTNYRCVNVHVVTNTGTLSFQESSDNTTYVSKPLLLSSSSNTTTSGNTASAGVLFYNTIASRSFRLSGTNSSAGTMVFSANPCPVHTMGVSSAQNGIWSVGSIPVAAVAAANSPLNSTSTANENFRSIKTTAAVLYSIACYNSKASAQWVLLFNSSSASAVADGVTTNATPIYCAATSNCTPLDYGQYGKYFSSGVQWTNSSTAPTKTIGSADVFCDARYQ